MTEQDTSPRPRTHAVVPPRRKGALYVNRVERRTFDGDCEFLRAPQHRAAIGTYLSDLLRPHGLALHEDLLASGAGQSYGEMGAALIGSIVGADEPVDLLVVAFAAPDVRPGRATATYLSHVCPGNPQSFAVCDQGAAAAYTGLRLVAEHVGSGACRRALLLVVEQATLHYDVPENAAVPTRNAGVALLCTDQPGTDQPGTDQPGAVRLDAVRVRTQVAPGFVTELAQYNGKNLIAGNGLDPGDLPPDARRGPAGQPLTAAWWELGAGRPAVPGSVSKGLAGLRRAQTTTGGAGRKPAYNTGMQTSAHLAGSPPGSRLASTNPWRQTLVDYEPSLRYLCTATFTAEGGAS